MVIVNGQCVAQGSQFSLADVEVGRVSSRSAAAAHAPPPAPAQVVTASIDLDDIRSFRGAMASRGQQVGPPMHADDLASRSR